MTNEPKTFDHFSPSHINDFIERRAKWYLTRVRGFKTTMGVFAHRGTAVEAGVVHGLLNDCPHNEAVAEATRMYSSLCAGLTDTESVGASIPAMVESLIEELHPLGKPESIQRKIEGTFRATGDTPWIGYTDIEFPDFIVDIKTKKTTPNGLTGGWKRQGAFYSQRTNKPVKFVCAIARKKVTIKTIELTPEDAKTGIAEIEYYATALKSILALGDEMMAHICAPEPGDWMLKDKEFYDLAVKVWPHLQ